jgi:endonuclease/exonuclease/phosphatase family metal-dependent hydrolase
MRVSRLCRALGALGVLIALGASDNSGVPRESPPKQRCLNYDDPHGPRFFGSYAAPIAGGQLTPRDGSFNVITFNIQFARRVDLAARVLAEAGSLPVADVILLQEMDAVGTQLLAERLGMNYVYYPATIHRQTRRDFGNAILARWPILRDQKLELPHASLLDGSRRVATCATLGAPDLTIDVCSVHIATAVELLPAARREQVRSVLDHFTGATPVIIGGDFNSYGLGNLMSGDAFRWPTRDIGRTTRYFSVDHIFARGLQPSQVGKVQDTLGASDHAAVWTKLAWR